MLEETITKYSISLIFKQFFVKQHRSSIFSFLSLSFYFKNLILIFRHDLSVWQALLNTYFFWINSAKLSKKASLKVTRLIEKLKTLLLKIELTGHDQWKFENMMYQNNDLKKHLSSQIRPQKTKVRPTRRRRRTINLC